MTRADFASEEEFAKWKEWSDAEYHDTDNRDSRYGRETVSLEWTAERETATPAVDVQLSEAKSKSLVTAIMESKLTAVQRRRIWMYAVDHLTEKEIADREQVAQQTVSRSIQSAVKVLKKYL